jgi:hypothetical protein
LPINTNQQPHNFQNLKLTETSTNSRQRDPRPLNNRQKTLLKKLTIETKQLETAAYKENRNPETAPLINVGPRKPVKRANFKDELKHAAQEKQNKLESLFEKRTVKQTQSNNPEKFEFENSNTMFTNQEYVSSPRIHANGSNNADSDMDGSVQDLSAKDYYEQKSIYRLHIVKENEKAFLNEAKKANKNKNRNSVINEAIGNINLSASGKAKSSTLDKERKSMAYRTLEACDNNWFTLKKTLVDYLAENKNPEMKEKCNQILFDVRQIQIEMQKKFESAINEDFNSINEYGLVKTLNKAFFDVFSKEASTVFDTNFYSSHAMLKEGVQPNETWQNQNEIYACVKMAIQFIHEGKKENLNSNDIDKNWNNNIASNTKEMNKLQKKQTTQIFKQAMNKAKERNEKINNEIIKLNSDPTLINKSNKMTTEEKESFVMNRLYEKHLEPLQVSFSRLRELERKISSIDNKIKQFSNPKEEIIDIEFDDSENENLTKLNELENQKEKLQTLKKELEQQTIELQSEALLYANEPYFSQAAVVHVVIGMQSFHKPSDDFITSTKSTEPNIADKDILSKWQEKCKNDYGAILDNAIGMRIAANENAGDVKKCQIEHPYDSSSDASTLKSHLLKMSKYAKRCISLHHKAAKTQLKSKPNDKNLQDYKTELKELLNTINNIYDIKQGKKPQIARTASTDTTSQTTTLFDQVKENPTIKNYCKSNNIQLSSEKTHEILDTLHKCIMSLDAKSRLFS